VTREELEKFMEENNYEITNIKHFKYADHVVWKSKTTDAHGTLQLKIKLEDVPLQTFKNLFKRRIKHVPI